MIIKGNVGSLKKVVVTFVITFVLIFTVGLGSAAQLGLINTPELLDDGDDESIFQAVPNDANVVARFDISGLEKDNTSQKVLRNFSDDLDNSSEVQAENFVREAIKPANGANQTESSVSFDESDTGEVVLFSSIQPSSAISGESQTGTIIEIELSENQFMKFQHNTTDYSVEDYNDGKILKTNESNQSYVGVIGDNLYVVGSERTVRKTIDTASGDKPAIDRSKIPDVKGDTLIHVVGYNMTGFLDSVNVTGEGTPIPDSMAMTYTTIGDETVVIELQVDSKNPFKSINSAQDISNATANTSETLDVKIEGNTSTFRYEVNPENVDNVFSGIRGAYGIESSDAIFGRDIREDDIPARSEEFR